MTAAVSSHGIKPFKRAIRACELSGKPMNVMDHMGGVESAALMTWVMPLSADACGTAP